MKRVTTVGLLFMAFFSHSGFVSAHGGRLDASGCHGGSKPYHCHRAPSEMVPSTSGGSRLRCSAGSASQDCSTNTASSGNVNSKELEDILATPRNTRFYKDGKNYYVDAKINSGYRVNLFRSNDNKVFAIEAIDSTCSEYQPELSSTNKSLTLNGNKIELRKQCLGFLKSNLYPMYVNDKELLISTFRKANSVILSVDYKQMKFSALGFTNAYNSL
jgi:hypothetical protein